MVLGRAPSRIAALAGVGLGLGSSDALAEWALNLPRGVTPISQEAYDLHMLILVICVLIGIVVFAAMGYSMLVHRKSRGANAAQFHHSTAAEIVWTAIPFVILVGMAIPATRALIVMEDTSEAEYTIKATGYQWKWKYEYLGEGVLVYSNLDPVSRAAIHGDPLSAPNYLLAVDNTIAIPVDKKVRLLLTADDVLHAWWVPEFGMKKDAIPGFINELWIQADTVGTYRGQCAELCGKDHGFMPIVVEVLEQEDYDRWIAERQSAAAAEAVAAAREWQRDELMAKGERVYARSCAACHQADGSGIAGTFPAIQGSRVATGDPAEHLRVVLEGRPDSAMRGFADALSDTELAAVVTYQRNALGNATGDLVQPARVSAARHF